MIETPRWITTPDNPAGIIVWSRDEPAPVPAPAPEAEPEPAQKRQRGRPRKA